MQRDLLLSAAGTGGGTGDSAYPVTAILGATDMSGGDWDFTLMPGLSRNVSRSFLVGQTVLVAEGDDAGVWVVTAKPDGDPVPCTPVATSFTGGDRIVSATGQEAIANPFGSYGVTMIGAATGLHLDRQQPFAAALHVGDDSPPVAGSDDGEASAVIDPDVGDDIAGLVGAATGDYAGLPLYRPATFADAGTPSGTFGGYEYPLDVETVVYASHQGNGRNGVWELFHSLASIGYVEADVEAGGVLFEDFGIASLEVGPYLIATVIWNGLFFDEGIVGSPSPFAWQVTKAGTPFYIGGGVHERELWYTGGDGLRSGAVPGVVAA
jgi:hypothetical protein